LNFLKCVLLVSTFGQYLFLSFFKFFLNNVTCENNIVVHGNGNVSAT